MAGRKISALGRRGANVGEEFIVQIHGVGTTGGVNQCFFTAPPDKRFIAVQFGGRWSTATSVSGGTASVERVPSGTAVGSGTNMCSTEIAADGTANTNAYGVLNDTEGTGNNVVEPGESLYLKFTGNSGTLTALAGGTFWVTLREIPQLAGA